MENKNIRVYLTAGLIFAAIGIYFLVLSMGTAKVGLYQYVRKAVRYIEEGKYQKAIFMLHKAYEEMPESEDIRKNLLMGYVRYAEELDDNGNLDKALEYLDMANEMDENDPVVNQYIAVFSAKKASQAAKDGDKLKAAEFLKRSVKYALKGDRAKRNTANYLYNSAVEAYNAGDNNTAIMCANAAYSLTPSFDAADLLGQCYYRVSDLANAKIYWEKALKKRPGNKEVKDKLDKAGKEMMLEEGRKELSTEKFVIKFHKGYGADEDKLAGLLQEIYKNVGEDLAYYPPPGTEIVFYDEYDFRDIFKTKGIIRAFYDGSIRMAVAGGLQNPLIAGTVAHEYTHAVVTMTTNGRAPVWLHEGLAVLEQSRYTPVVTADAERKVKEGNPLSIKSLDEGFSNVNNEKGLKISYQGSYLAVLFMVEKWGWAGIKGLLARMKDGLHYANAIDEQFYVSVNMFENMLNEYVAERIRS